MIHFSLPEEERWFNERHSSFLELLPALNDTLDNVLKHTVTADRQGLTVFMLGRRCANDFSEILLLTSNGYGFAALQILRSMFEKLVDARYLHEHPKEVDYFWDYHLVLLVKLGYQDIVQRFDSEWENKIAKFKTAGTKRNRTQPRWSKLSLVDEAKQVGWEIIFTTHTLYLTHLSTTPPPKSCSLLRPIQMADSHRKTSIIRKKGEWRT